MEPLNNCHQFFQSRGIPKEFVAFSTDDYLEDYSEALAEIGAVNHQFFTNLQHSLNLIFNTDIENIDGYVLQGCNGCGKTGWASALIREALLFGINSLMISMPGMIDEYYNSPTKKLNPDYAHMDILVIDEVGKELQKNTSFSILERVLLHRHNAGKKTILISNMSIDSMVTLYGATVKSRLNLFNSIVFPVIDFRRNNKTSLQINTINNNGKKDLTIIEEF